MSSPVVVQLHLFIFPTTCSPSSLALLNVVDITFSFACRIRDFLCPIYVFHAFHTESKIISLAKLLRIIYRVYSSYFFRWPLLSLLILVGYRNILVFYLFCICCAFCLNNMSCNGLPFNNISKEEASLLYLAYLEVYLLVKQHCGFVHTFLKQIKYN